MNIANPYPFKANTSQLSFLRTFQITFWVFFTPSVWFAKIQEIRPNLAPNFCLTDLSMKEWRSTPGRQLLLTPILIWSFLVFLISLICGAATRNLNTTSGLVEILNMALTGGLVALFGSLLVGACISFAGGLLFGFNAGLVHALVPASSLLFYLLIAFTAGLAGSLMRLHQPVLQPIRLTPRTLKASALWLALIVLFIIVGVSIANEFFFDNELNVNVPFQNPFSTTLLLADALLIGSAFSLMIGPRSAGWLKGILIAAITALIAVFLTLGMRETAFSHPTVFILLSSPNYALLYTLIFGLVFSMVNFTGWLRPAIYLGAMAAGALWIPVAIFVMKSFSFNLAWFALTPTAVGVGLTQRLWRPLIFFFPWAVWNLMLFSSDQERLPGKNSRIKYHPAFWDETNYIVWPRLDQHILLVARHAPEEARQAMSALVYGRQRRAVFQALLELTAQEFENLEKIQELNTQHHPLQSLFDLAPFADTVQKFFNLAEDIKLAERQTSSLNMRATLAIVRSQVSELQNHLRFSQEWFAVRFIPVTVHWNKLLTNQLDHLAQIAEQTREIPNPYVFGVPIRQNQGVFVGRADIFHQIEHLLLAPIRPPLFLYGQRRMGKTSLLLNLTSTLPSTIIPFFIDCQALGGITNFAEFFYGMARQMTKSVAKIQTIKIPPFSIEHFPFDTPFLAFAQWLDELEEILEHNQQTGMIILDEFVALDDIFWNAGLQPDDFLMHLRHNIQHRERFRVLVSGSHSLLQTDKWAGYLINMQIIKLGYLKEAEARSLIEAPVNDFPLSYQPEAVDKFLKFTRGHPALVQMMGYEMVEYKNSQALPQRYHVLPEDIEQIVPAVLENGAFYFEDLRRQLTTDALKLLAALAAKGSFGSITVEEWLSGQPNNFDPSLKILLNYDLVEATGNNHYRFQIELVRRWLWQKMESGTLFS